MFLSFLFRCRALSDDACVCDGLGGMGWVGEKMLVVLLMSSR